MIWRKIILNKNRPYKNYCLYNYINDDKCSTLFFISNTYIEFIFLHYVPKILNEFHIFAKVLYICALICTGFVHKKYSLCNLVKLLRAT